MKLEDLQEAAKDFTPLVQALKKSKEFEEVLKTFDYKTTARQEKNGNMYFETKPEIMKIGREYQLNWSGALSAKNVGTSIWGKINAYGPLSVQTDSDRVEGWKRRLTQIGEHFMEWAIKKNKSKTDVSNRRLTSLVPLMLPETVKGDYFICSNNSLTDLLGGPTEVRYYQAGDNDLVSPLVGAPTKVDVLSLDKNRLTTFEGITPELISLGMTYNPIQRITGISTHIKRLQILTISLVENTGYLELFKIPNLQTLQMYGDADVKELARILTKHLGGDDRDLLDCKEELMATKFRWAAKI